MENLVNPSWAAFQEAYPRVFEPRRHYPFVVVLSTFSYALLLGAGTVALVALAAGKGSTIGLAICAFCTCVVAVTLVQPAVIVGLDGIRFGPVYNRRFIPYSDLISVARLASGIQCVTGVETLAFRTGPLQRDSPMLTTIVERRAESARLGKELGALRPQAPYRGGDIAPLVVVALQAALPWKEREDAIRVLARDEDVAVALSQLSNAVADPRVRTLLDRAAAAHTPRVHGPRQQK